MPRQLLAASIGAAVFGAVVLGAAGCSTDKTPSAAATAQTGATAPSGPSAAAGSGSRPGGDVAAQNAGDAKLAGNTAAICNQAARTSGQFGAVFAQDLKLLIDAESATDKGQSGKVRQKTTTDVASYSFALNDMSKLAADPAVKQALADMSKQVTALQGDVRKIDDKKLDKLRATLDKACGK